MFLTGPVAMAHGMLNTSTFRQVGSPEAGSCMLLDTFSEKKGIGSLIHWLFCFSIAH